MIQATPMKLSGSKQKDMKVGEKLVGKKKLIGEGER